MSLGVFVVGTLIVALLTGGLAILVERFAYRPLRGANRIAPLITALGVSIVLLELGRIIGGAQPRAFPPVFQEQVYELGKEGSLLEGVIVQRNQIFILLTTLVVMAGLSYIVMKTKMGRAMRALSYDMDACRLMGVNLNSVIAFEIPLPSNSVMIGIARAIS